MTDQEFLKEVVGATNRVSRQHQETALKQLKSIEEEVKQLEQRRSKIFEAYECSILTSDEFIERKKQINQELSRVQNQKKEAESMLQEDGEVTYEYVRSIMEHFHCILDTAEIYYCFSGHGYMLLESPEGDWSALELLPGKAIYVPQRYAHRSINVDPVEPLRTFFVFGADAGHDYGTIETKGYRKLMIDDKGNPVIKDNPKWN